MLLNGKVLENLEFSPLDADDMERYDKALQHMIARDEEFKEAKLSMGKTYEAIRFQCHTIFEFFNIVFGEGTDRLIFGDKTDLGVCYTTLSEFTLHVGEGGNKVVEVASKYLASRIDRTPKPKAKAGPKAVPKRNGQK